MSCCGRGPSRVIGHLLDDVWGDGRWQRGADERWVDPRGEVEQRVKMMYARGEITTDTYRRLMEMAERGQLNEQDMARLQGETQTPAGPERETPPKPQRDPAIVSSLNRLYGRRTRLESARSETEQVLQKLETEAKRLRERAQTADQQAQRLLPDEARAREYLQVKQDVLERVRTLDDRIATLRDSLRRIASLHDELATREAELKALQSGEQLAELESGIREDLLNDR